VSINEDYAKNAMVQLSSIYLCFVNSNIMAGQEGLIKLKGRIGDLTFYKTKNGFQARAKTGVSSSRIANDPNYQRTRENGAEFGRACKAGKLLRNAIKPLTSQVNDSGMINRLMKEMLKVIQADTLNLRGLREVLDAETEMLNGFEFNVNGTVSQTISAPYIASIDRVSGVAKVNFAAFNAKKLISRPLGATHFKFTVAAVAVDFENEIFELDEKATENLLLNAQSIAPVELSCALSANATKPIFLLLGINFYQELNGVSYSLSNGTYNGLRIISVSGS
jgi:hypothetical protein